MVNTIKHKLGLNNSLNIVGIIDKKGTQEYFYAVITKDKTELHIDSFTKGIANIDDIVINENTPLIIAFSGHGIVYSDGDNSVINNNFDDYFVTEYKTDKNTFTSFSRKDKIDKTLQYFIDKKYYIIDVFIGVLSINLLYKKVFELNSIHVSDIQLEYDGNDLVNTAKTVFDNTSEITINNERKNTLEVFLFSIGFHHFFTSNKLSNYFNHPIIESNQADAKYKKQFELFTKIGFFVFLLSLLINFTVNKVTTNKINNITNLVSNTTNYQNEFNYLNTEKNRKLEVIQMAGFLNTNYLSFYINEIGAIIPNEIVLKELNILPINKTIEKGKQITINDRKIEVVGITNSNNAFNTFLSKLKTKKWVGKIEIISYENAKRNKSNFKLEINLK